MGKKVELLLTPDELPVHVGIIMDGNGRWAKKRGMPRKIGHRQGAKVFKQTVEDCRELGIKYVTFYAFSTENWKRPEDEVNALMNLFDQYLNDIKKMAQKNTRIVFLGDKSAFSDTLRNKMIETEQISENNNGIIVSIAANYGGKDEILNAVKRIALEYKSENIDVKNFTEHDIDKYLYTAGFPQVDMILRPSGEQRTSNFLIWQAAYAELVFLDVLWPDFNKDNLISALNEYGKRNRRFGCV